MEHLKELFIDTERSIRKINDLVEHNVLEEEVYPLDSFRYNQGFILDLLAELRDCINSY